MFWSLVFVTLTGFLLFLPSEGVPSDDGVSGIRRSRVLVGEKQRLHVPGGRKSRREHRELWGIGDPQLATWWQAGTLQLKPVHR